MTKQPDCYPWSGGGRPIEVTEEMTDAGLEAFDWSELEERGSRFVFEKVFRAMLAAA